MNELAVARRQHVAVQPAQASQRVDVGLHVPVGRIDHDGRAVDHVIPRKQPVALRVPVADVVGGVAGRVHGFENEVGALETLGVAEKEIGLEGLVLLRAVTTTQRIGAPARRMMSSMWLSMTGPGSSTAISAVPTR